MKRMEDTSFGLMVIQTFNTWIIIDDELQGTSEHCRGKCVVFAQRQCLLTNDKTHTQSHINIVLTNIYIII